MDDLSTLLTDAAETAPEPMPEPMRRVRLDASTGAIACGPYRAGVEYDVPASEASRLVTAKRFEYVPNAPLDGLIVSRINLPLVNAAASLPLVNAAASLPLVNAAASLSAAADATD